MSSRSAQTISPRCVRGTLLAAGTFVREGAAGALQVRPHEPLELLQLPGLPDQQILRDLVEFVGLVDGLANVLDHTGVDKVQRGQVSLDRVAAYRVVVPVPVVDDRVGRALGEAPSAAMRSATSSA